MRSLPNIAIVLACGNVPVPRCAAEWLLCLAKEPVEPPGSGRCSADGAAAAGLERQWQGGYRNLQDDLLDHGETCSPNRVARFARLAGIKAQIGYKRRPGSYGGGPSLAVDNTLDRQFDVAAPDRAWGDRHHLHPHPGGLCLSGRRDRPTNSPIPLCGCYRAKPIGNDRAFVCQTRAS